MMNKLLIAKYKCEDMYNKLCKKVDLSGVMLELQILSDDTIQFHDYAKLALNSGALAGTYTNFMINIGDDINDISTTIKYIYCSIFIPESIIKKIIDKCKFKPWDFNFCISFILRHELGHVIDFKGYIGQTVVECNKSVEKNLNILNDIKSSIYGDKNYLNLDEWKKMNKSSIERRANEIAKLTDKDLEKFYNIILKNEGE